MAPRRYLRCLGQPALFAATGELIRFRTKKHLALLVYLAIEADQQHRRDRLAELLWPKVSLAEARHSLATALSVLRPRVGADGLRATRDQVTLAGGHLALDLERLAAGDLEGSETSAPLEVAPFLEGFDITDAGEFGLWKDRQQARWLPAVMHAFGRGLERCRRVGDTRQIEQIADKMLAQDPACEDAVRAKMEVLAFAGDRLAALRLYEAWRRRIAEELDAVPSAPLERMAARLRQRGWERATLDHLPSAPPDQRRGRPFIGRETEYRTLYDAWQALRQGTNSHILLTGESGVGKTRLVERLTTAAGLDGAAVSRVQSYELEQEIPYATVSGLILGLLAYPEVSGTPPEALAELSRTVPDVRRRFPAIPPARDSQGDTARIELAEAFHQLLQAIAEERPIILVVDDVHLADDASLSVLHLVARRAKGERLMMIFIARLGGGAPPQAIERLMHGGAGPRHPAARASGAFARGKHRAAHLPGRRRRGSRCQQGLEALSSGQPVACRWCWNSCCRIGSPTAMPALALAVSAMTSELAGDGKGPETYRHILAGLVRVARSSRSYRARPRRHPGAAVERPQHVRARGPEPRPDPERTGAAGLAPDSAGDRKRLRVRERTSPRRGVCLACPHRFAGRCTAALPTGSSRWSQRRTCQGWKSRGIACGLGGGRRRSRTCCRVRGRRCAEGRRIWRSGRWRRRCLRLTEPNTIIEARLLLVRGIPRTGSVARLSRPSPIHVCHLWRTANVRRCA